MTPTMPTLENGLVVWWDCKQDVSAGHTLMDLSGNGHHLLTEGSELDTVNDINWGVRKATSYTDDAVFGNAITPDTIYLLNESAFQLATGDYTVSFWFRVPSYDASNSYTIIQKAGNIGSLGLDYYIWFASRILTVEYADPALIQGAISDPIWLEDTWIHAVVWRDSANTTFGMLINGGDIGYTPNLSAAGGADSNYPLFVGNVYDNSNIFSPVIADLAMWNRVLTEEERIWLYNSGTRRSYLEINPSTTAEEDLNCREQECCPPTEFNNDAECDPDEATVAVGSPTPCLEQAMVFSEPPSGIEVVFPIWVRLYSDNALATIRYTTDGTDPVETSTLYSGPIAVTQASTIIRARAYVANCPDGDIELFSWIASYEPFIFCYKGLSGDQAGQWNDFTSNGTTDLRWWLDPVNIANDVEVTHFELYQLDSNLLWTTGQAWSTKEYITPPFSTWDQTQTFHVFPLVIFDQVPAQINAAYTDAIYDDLGVIPATGESYDLYGDPVIAPADYFLLIIYHNSAPIWLYTDTTICADPPPCPLLDEPTLTPLCKRVDVQVTVPGAAKDYEVYAAPCTDPTNFTLITSGNATGVVNYSYTGLAADCQYCFYWRIDWTGDATYNHCGWVASDTICVTTSCEPSASLTADPAVVCLGDSFDLDYVTACAGAGSAITLVSGTPGDIDVGFPQAVTPNTSGSITVTPSAVGSWTFRLTAPTPVAGCSNDTSDVTVQAITIPAYNSDCSSLASTVRITQYRHSVAAAPWVDIDHFVIRAIKQTPDPVISAACIFWRGICTCLTASLPERCLDATWNFTFARSDLANRCEWKMSGVILPRGLTLGTVNPEGTALAINGLSLEESSFFYVYDPVTVTGTRIAIEFTDYWVLTLQAKLLCSPSTYVGDCWDLNSTPLWRGFKDCSGGPAGEYVSDWHVLPAGTGAVATRNENSHVYSLKVE